MLIKVKVIPGARKVMVADEDGWLRVHLTAPPQDGRANEALIEVLSGHFDVRRSRISIIKGLKSRNKMVNISPR